MELQNEKDIENSSDGEIICVMPLAVHTVYYMAAQKNMHQS